MKKDTIKINHKQAQELGEKLNEAGFDLRQTLTISSIIFEVFKSKNV